MQPDFGRICGPLSWTSFCTLHVAPDERRCLWGIPERGSEWWFEGWRIAPRTEGQSIGVEHELLSCWRFRIEQGLKQIEHAFYKYGSTTIIPNIYIYIVQVQFYCVLMDESFTDLSKTQSAFQFLIPPRKCTRSLIDFFCLLKHHLISPAATVWTSAGRHQIEIERTVSSRLNGRWYTLAHP